ncbi:peptide ABC transporter substrate-binding protein [Aminobacter sp. NyZ550]|jgi:oligopeptide transport system substrate-binding protein|uniref:ABC transporter substrate-binding protein n=2 Tax=Aminobacter TaxID=31988 RepID=A0AAC8YSJ6_AMIAI|nr:MULTISPECIES: peptide ABC transporter substrate-binding protein [Aminobacter]AMS43647.1 ABC transporter substrate-binding protein [Aminobacter aminovorans]MBA8909986.1 oligopeptide transport system substrate-binding protein [Aminobacter ciceronei]MBA9023758.1 oligopeptide transport system substrate-binding protein [Aminobacter ciceronei]MBB3705211.1 oligopeptide transport system substrate-binding protein [Aminobacter aminovorans]MRX34880.1 peptide ABC transporter substrate-binding protein [
MLKNMLKATVFATTLALSAGALSVPAFAEVVFNRGNSADPESLDPHKTSTVYEAHILRDLFEGLVMQDQNAEIIPGAAESWTVSDDGTVYTFKLRQGATWSDGSPVTAEDFVYSFRRLEDPATGAEYASMLYVVKNGEEVNTGKAKPEELGVKAVDANTFEVTLKAPTPYFLEMLTHQSTYPVNKAAIDKLGADWIKPGNLVSNGAFTLAEFVPNDHIKLVKNPKFHDAANVKLDAVNYFPTEDRSTAIKRFEAGELDSNDDIPTEQMADLKAKFGDQLRIGAYLGTYYYAIKTDKAPWDNVELRNAVSMAIDRDFLAEKVWQNSMIPGYSMVPPGIEGYTSALATFADKSQIDREDEAKKVLEKLGYGPDKPLKMEIRYNTSENHKNTAVAIQEQLKPLGIEVTLLNTDTKTHYGHLEQKGDFDVARAGWIADYKDPESFLGISRKASGNNYSNYNSPKFEEAMNKAAAAGGKPEERLKEMAAAERILIDDVGQIPLLYYSYKNLVSPKIKGFDENVMDVHPSRFVSKD